jgi:hypothetical protein
MVKADWEWVTREGSSTRGCTVCDKVRRVGPWTHERSTPHGGLEGIPPSKIRKRETHLHLPAEQRFATSWLSTCMLRARSREQFAGTATVLVSLWYIRTERISQSKTHGRGIVCEGRREY